MGAVHSGAFEVMKSAITEVKSLRAIRAKNETDLAEALDRVVFLENALKRITDIDNKMQGADWEEIEEARQVASDALIGVITPFDEEVNETYED